jgi:hypothetical protein
MPQNAVMLLRIGARLRSLSRIAAPIEAVASPVAKPCRARGDQGRLRAGRHEHRHGGYVQSQCRNNGWPSCDKVRPRAGGEQRRQQAQYIGGKEDGDRKRSKPETSSVLVAKRGGRGAARQESHCCDYRHHRWWFHLTLMSGLRLVAGDTKPHGWLPQFETTAGRIAVRRIVFGHKGGPRLS